MGRRQSRTSTYKHDRAWGDNLWPQSLAGPISALSVAPIKIESGWKRWVRTMQNFFKATPSWSKEEAFYAILLASAWADRSVQREEERELAALLSRTPLLSSLPKGRKDAIHAMVMKSLRGDFQNTVEIACASLPEEMRIAAFSHAVDIAFADKQVLPLEALYLNKLAELLAIPQDTVENIAGVLEAKNAF